MGKMKRHYTYILEATNPADERRLYVGVRSCNCAPLADASYLSSSRHVRAAIKSGTMFSKRILAEWATRAEAVAHEMQLHSDLGVVASSEYFNLAKQTAVGFDTSGVKITGDRLRKMKDSSLAAFADPAVREKQKAGMHAANLLPETKKRRSEAASRLFSNPDILRKHKAAMKAVWADPERRAAQSARTAELNRSDSKRAAVSAANSKPCTEQRRESMRIAMTGKQKSPAHRESMRKTQQLRKEAAQFFNVQMRYLGAGMFAMYKRLIEDGANTMILCRALQQWAK